MVQTAQSAQHMGPHSLLQFSHRCSKVFLILVKCPLTIILVCIALFIVHSPLYSHQNVKMTITNINLCSFLRDPRSLFFGALCQFARIM